MSREPTDQRSSAVNEGLLPVGEVQRQFYEWWEANQVDPRHGMITQNCALATWHAAYDKYVRTSIPAQRQPGREWRCFHCDEVFTDPKAAANHFGVDHVGDETLCQMAQVDGGIARVIADLAEELQRYRSEDNTSYREFYALGADHRLALIKEEQKGYDRGLADARAEASALPPTNSRSPK